MMQQRSQDAAEQLKEDLEFNEKNLLKLQESRKSIELIKDTSKDFIQKWLTVDDDHLSQGEITTLETMESDFEQYLTQHKNEKKEEKMNKKSKSKRNRNNDPLHSSSFSSLDDIGMH